MLEASADGGALKTERKGVSLYDVGVLGRAAHAGLEPEQGRQRDRRARPPGRSRVAALGDPAPGTTVTPTASRRRHHHQHGARRRRRSPSTSAPGPPPSRSGSTPRMRALRTGAPGRRARGRRRPQPPAAGGRRPRRAVRAGARCSPHGSGLPPVTARPRSAAPPTATSPPASARRPSTASAPSAAAPTPTTSTSWSTRSPAAPPCSPRWSPTCWRTRRTTSSDWCTDHDEPGSSQHGCRDRLTRRHATRPGGPGGRRRRAGRRRHGARGHRPRRARTRSSAVRRDLGPRRQPAGDRRAAARLHQGRQLRRRRVRRTAALVGACVGFFHAPGRGRAAQPHRRRRARRWPGGTSASPSSCTSGRGRCARGVSEIAWTFDPLVSRNAYFNLRQARRASRRSTCPNFYGAMHDAINGDDDSDRLLVRWRLRDPAVVAACAAGTRRRRRRRARRRRGGRARRLRRRRARARPTSTGDRAGRRAPRHRGAARRRPGARPAVAGRGARGARRAGRRRRPDRRASTAPAGTSCRRRAVVKLHRRRAAPGRDAAGVAVPDLVRDPDRARRPAAARVVTDEAEGWGECVAMADPLYSSEYVDAAADVLRRFLVPALASRPAPLDAHAVAPAAGAVQGPPDGQGRARDGASSTPSCAPQGRSFARELGRGPRPRARAGCRSGIMDSVPRAARRGRRLPRRGLRADQAEDRARLGRRAGARRARAVRRRRAAAGRREHRVHPRATPGTWPGSTPFDLLLIEQPLDEEDVLGHADLARLIRTPICLDESIVSAQTAAAAIRAGRLRDRQHQARPGRRLPRGARGSTTSASPTACRSGAAACSRPASAARPTSRSAALPGFTLPGDISASGRYYRDRHHRAVRARRRPPRRCPTGPGSGVDADPGRSSTRSRPRRSGSRSERCAPMDRRPACDVR